MNDMDIDDINKEIERIGLPKRQPGRAASMGAKHAAAKVMLVRFLALLLLGVVMGFSLLVIAHFKGDANVSRIALVILIYLALGGLLAYKLWKLTYIGWLFSLLLALTGIFLSLLTFLNKGYMLGILGVLIISLVSSAALWWVRDLFGIKHVKDLLKPH